MQKRRWLIYRSADKEELAAISDPMIFAGIIGEFQRYVDDNRIDLADAEVVRKAIQESLPERAQWPELFCIDIF